MIEKNERSQVVLEAKLDDEGGADCSTLLFDSRWRHLRLQKAL